MDKPVSIVYNELREEIVKAINTSGLPAFVIEYVLKDFLAEISEIAKNQYEQDMQQYAAYIDSQNSDTDDGSDDEAVDAEVVTE